MIDALQNAGITLRSHRGGNHRVPCPACHKSPRDTALSVTIDDDGAVWQCFRCGWTGNTTSSVRREGERRPRPRRDDPKPATLSGQSMALWRESCPITSDKIGGKYLTSRCCAIPQNDVRLHRGIWHPQERREIPCIISLITDIVTCEPISLHMTFIAGDGSSKAPIERPRMYLAGHRKQGGVVRLHPDADVEQGLIIGEGLETCLSYALEFRPVWACLDAGNIAAFPVLLGIEGLTVLIDHDPAGQSAFEKVRDRYQASDRDVIGVKSPIAGEDLNDMVSA